MTTRFMIRALGNSRLALLVFLAGIALTLMAWHATSNREEESLRQDFALHVDDALVSLRQRLDAYAYTLYGTRGLFAANDAVSRDEFRRYVAATGLGEHHPGVHTFAFIRRVAADEKDRFERRVRGADSKGYADFAITPPGARDEYFVIEYIEPESRYRYLLGVDRGAQADTRQTLERARDSGQPAASGRLHSEAERAETTRFFLLALPIYRQGANPTTVAERRAALLGFVAARIEFNTLFKDVIGASVREQLFFELYDGGHPADAVAPMSRETLLFAADEGKSLHLDAAAAPARFTREVAREVGGRAWLLFFGSRAEHPPGGGILPVVVLLGGMVTSFLLFALVQVLVAQRQRVRDEVVRQKSLFSQVMDALPVNIFLKDRDFRFVLANAETARTIGLPHAEIIGKTDFDVFPHETARALREHDEQVRADGRLIMREERLAASGQEHVMLAGKKIIHLPGSDEPMLLGFAFDITERLALEQEAARARANELSRALANAVGVGLIGTDTAHRVVFANPKAQELLGIDEAAMLGRKLDDVVQIRTVAGEDLTDATCPAWRGIAGGEGFETDDWQFRRGDGARMPVSAVIVPILDPRQNLGAVMSFQDITARKRAESALALALTQQKAFLNNLPEMAWLKDQESRYVLANEATARACGRAPEAMVGGTDFDFWPRELAESYRADDRLVMASGEHKRVVEPFEGTDGKRLWIETIKSPIWNISGQVIGTVGTARDVTERIRAEGEIGRHMAELARVNAELDEFTYVASHDLQEPVRKLVAFSDLLRKDMGDAMPPRAEQDLAFIADAALRMQRLVKDLLALSRAGKVSMVHANVALDHAVDVALEALALRIEESGATVERVPLPMVWGNLTLLAQLYQNLIGNALKFVRQQPPVVRLTAEEIDGKWVLGVRDNGIGIDAKYAEQIFLPFKRLHGQGHFSGSGVGLSICRKVVERHYGRIWVESSPGQGAWFKFTLGRQGAPS